MGWGHELFFGPLSYAVHSGSAVVKRLTKTALVSGLLGPLDPAGVPTWRAQGTKRARKRALGGRVGPAEPQELPCGRKKVPGSRRLGPVIQRQRPTQVLFWDQVGALWW